MALDLGIFLEGAQSTFKVKVSDNDAQAQYLIDKLISSDGSVTITETNDGGIETIDLTVAGGSDTNIANTDLTNDANHSVNLNTFKQGFTNGEVGIGTATPDNSSQLEVSATDKGLLIPRVTTAQMNAISTPATNLLVFNTDLEALYRYDGANWIALSAGYGIVSVNDGSGNPTFYASLQTALNNTADIDAVYIHSDIEVTSEITVPLRSSLTIHTNGYRIWGDTSGGDFNIFEFDNTTGTAERIFNLEGGGIIETIGTVVDVNNAAPIYGQSLSVLVSFYANDVKIRSVNANCFYTNGFTTIQGGYFYSENSGGVLVSSETRGIHLDVYNRPTLGSVYDSYLKSRFEGFQISNTATISNCVVIGDVTQSGNYGLLYIYQGTHCTNNYIEQTNTSGRDALYVRGSSGSDGRVSNNICINRGSGSGGNFIFGQGHDNYFYSESGYGLYVGANCKEFSNNKCFTNATNKQAMYTLGDITAGNYCENLNATNTVEALFVGGTTNEVFNNKAVVANSSAYNIKLNSTGTIYLANNVMNSVGLGLDLNGNTNAMTNTPDTYGNIQIG